MKERTHLLKKRLSLAILTCLFVAACRPTPMHTPSPTPPQTTESHTPTTLPTSTPGSNPTATLTTTPSTAPTKTETRTPTPSPTPEPPALGQTPLPIAGQMITAENAAQVSHLAIWGKGRANAMALSPNGRVLAVATEIGVFLYDSLTYELVGLIRTDAPVIAVAFSPDDRWLALSELKGTVRVYSRNGLDEIATLPFLDESSPTLSGSSLHFSPDNQQVISLLKTYRDLHVRVWGTEDWGITESFSVSRVTSFINPQTGILGVVDNLDNRSLTLISLEDPEETTFKTLPEEAANFSWYMFGYEILSGENGNYLLITNGTRVVRWDLEKTGVTYLIDSYPDHLCSGCAQAVESCRNVDGGFSWDCPSGPGSPPIEMIALTPDEIMFLVSVNDGRTEFRRTVDGNLYWEIDTQYIEVVFSPGGEFFFGLLPNGIIEKRATLDGTLIDFMEGHPSHVFDIAFSPDGSILAGAFSDGWIRIFSTINGQFLGVLTGQSRSLAFSPDGGLLAAGLTDGTLRIFRLEEGEYDDLPTGHQDVISDLMFSPDGTLLLSGSHDCTARLWDLSLRRAVSTVNPGGDHPFRIHNVALNPQNLHLFFTGNRNGVYRFQDSTPLPVLLQSVYQFADLAAAPDLDRMALTGPSTWLVTFPDGDALPETMVFEADPAAGLATDAYALDFSPAADLLFTASIQDIEFWSVSEGSLLHHLNIYQETQPNARPMALAVSPDGRLIALATRNGLIHIFGIPEETAD